MGKGVAKEAKGVYTKSPLSIAIAHGNGACVYNHQTINEYQRIVTNPFIPIPEHASKRIHEPRTHEPAHTPAWQCRFAFSIK